jgi:hypothetical protein
MIASVPIVYPSPIRVSLRAHPDADTGAPASGTARLHEPEPETPDRRPALRQPTDPLVADCIPLTNYNAVLWRAVTTLEDGKTNVMVQFYGSKN